MPKIQPRNVNPECYRTLVSQGISPPLARLYAARGVTSLQETQPKLSSLLPFEELKGIRQMTAELADAIEAQARLLIVADFDADGATSLPWACVGLRRLGATQVDYLVPNRFEYGYGLTPEIVALALERKPHLIITVDNGIASIAGVQAARAAGHPGAGD